MRRFALGLLCVVIGVMPTTTIAATSSLSRGMKNAEVLMLQHFLITQYSDFTEEYATGYFGATTEAAVKQWQSEHGIVSKGSAATTGWGAVGPKTRAAMGLSPVQPAAQPTSSSAASSTSDLIRSLVSQVEMLQARIAALKSASSTNSSSISTASSTASMNGVGTSLSSSPLGNSYTLVQPSSGSGSTQVTWLNQRLGLPANKLPFSFNYAGAPATQLQNWKLTESAISRDSNTTVHTATYSDPATGMQVRVVATEYRSTGAVEWLLWFKNTGSTKSPIIDTVLPLNTSLARFQPNVIMTRLGYAKGSEADASDFQPYSASTASRLYLSSVDGRSSGRYLPFFNLYGSNGGIIIAIGWSGDWAAEFNPVGSNDSTWVDAGMQKTHFYLNPGEEVRSPSILLLPWRGDDVQVGQNALRSFLLNIIIPPEAKVPPITISNWVSNFNSTSASGILNSLNNLMSHPLPIDSYWIDAGWFSSGWPFVGTWTADQQRFPGGLSSVANSIRTGGLKFLLWFEPERVTAGTELARSYPQWLLSQTSKTSFMPGDNKLFNLGNPSALAFAKQYFSGIASSLGLSFFRIDSNIEPAAYWKSNDTPDRQGISEMKYVAGLYEFLDYLRTQNPGMVIDNSASGGRRIDLEMMKRSVPLLHSDMTGTNSEAQQDITYGIANWIPIIGNQVVSDSSFSIENKRSRLGGALNIVADWGTYNSATWTDAAEYAALAKIMRPYFSADYYPLTGYGVSVPRLAMQFNDAATGAGFVQVFARGSAGPYTPALKGLEAQTQYKIVDIDDPNNVVTLSGPKLMSSGPHPELPMNQKNKAVVLVYEKSGLTGPVEQVQKVFGTSSGKGPIDVFLVAGQSNAVGAANRQATDTPDPLPITVPTGKVLQYKGPPYFADSSGSLAMNLQGKGSITDANDPVGTSNSNSAWPAFGKKYYELTGHRIAFVVVAAGGTSLSPLAEIPPNGNWSPDLVSTGNRLYGAYFMVDDALLGLKNAGYQPVLKGVLWSQGENDAIYIDDHNGVGYSGSDYQALLVKLIAALRARFSPTLPFYIFRTGTEVIVHSDAPGYVAIRGAQDAIAQADPNTKVVFRGAISFPCRGLMSTIDGIHYRTAGYNEMGEVGAQNVVAGTSDSVSQQTLCPTTVPASASVSTYSISGDFSLTQGSKQWYYEEAKAGSYVPLTAKSSLGMWQGDENGFPSISPTTSHPSPNADVALKWVAPREGSIRITGTVSDADGSCGDGVSVAILYDAPGSATSILWNSVVANGDSVGKTNDIVQSVKAGSSIRFIIDKIGDYTCDSTKWNPSITYQN